MIARTLEVTTES